jgi:ABC-type uncharacterized transport system substrate-binding protein
VTTRRACLIWLAGGILAAPIVTEAEQAAKVPRIGYLLARTTGLFAKSASEGLRDLGYIEGKNIVTEYRNAEGGSARYPQLAAELVRLDLDVIVADGAAATAALRRITTTIPIVMVAADPVEAGFVRSLAKPGGNITGLSTNSPTLMGKRLELLREAAPRVSRVSVIGNALNPAHTLFVAEAERAARSLGLHVASAPIRSSSEVDSLFAAIDHDRADALLISEDPTVVSAAINQITERALARRLPTIGGTATFARAGLLLTYGPDFAAMFRRTAVYVDKILKGAKPAELPVEEPTKFDLVINLKTAKALGLTVPPSLLLRADEVIQ